MKVMMGRWQISMTPVSLPMLCDDDRRRHLLAPTSPTEQRCVLWRKNA